MMKIKRKVEMNLPQLIEWAWDNNVKDKNLLADNNVTPLRISIGGEFIFDNNYIYSKNHTFTVEVEEEITEDTEFESMVEVTTDNLFAVWENASISTWKYEHSKEFHAYIDGEFKLIWTHEKGLVE